MLSHNIEVISIKMFTLGYSFLCVMPFEAFEIKCDAQEMAYYELKYYFVSVIN